MVVIVSKKKLPKASFEEEKKLWQDGVEYIIGVDEVGRGAFAGPIVAAAVIFANPKHLSKFNINLSEINDSKLLKPLLRRKLDLEIKKSSLAYAVSEVGVNTINNLGIGKAAQVAFRKAINSIMYQVLCIKYNKEKIQNTKYLLHDTKFFVLVDGFPIKYLKNFGQTNQKAIIKGDRKSISIAAASILAKVYRDDVMKKLGKEHKEYGFGRNKGYGTKIHQDAIKNYGLTKIHRKSFNLSKFL